MKIVSSILCIILSFSLSAQEVPNVCTGIPLSLSKIHNKQIDVLGEGSEDVASYESNPGSKNVLYLDFDGEYIAEKSFWSSSPINADPATYFNATDKLLICKRVAVDFDPFDVNITANKAVFDAAIQKQQVVFTPTNYFRPGVGGVASIGTFNQGEVAWVFEKDVSLAAEAASHEIGHTLGLHHDGKGTSEYYYGHGDWAPIMGYSGLRTMSQWSKGEYPGATMLQNDLVIISWILPYKKDDYGSDRTNPSILHAKMTDALGNFSGEGLISTQTDKDVFMFGVAGGNINLNFGCDSTGDFNNLRIEASIYDVSWTKIWSKNTTNLNMNSIINLSAGMYYLVFDGVGYLTNIDGYSDYGSLGKYHFSGNISKYDATVVDLSIVSTEKLAELTCNKQLTAKVTVKNTGNTTINNYKVVVKDNYAVLNSLLINKPIIPGESVTHEVVVTPSYFMNWEYTATLENVMGDAQSENDIVTSNQTKYYHGEDVEFTFPLDQRSGLFNWTIEDGNGKELISKTYFEPITNTTETHVFCLPKDSCFKAIVNDPFRLEWCSKELINHYKIFESDYAWQIGDTAVGYLNGEEALFLVNTLGFVGYMITQAIHMEPEKFTLLKCTPPLVTAFTFTNKTSGNNFFEGNYIEGKTLYEQEICASDIITNVQKIESELDAVIYPNPADGQIQFKSSAIIERVEIYNTMGQLVLQERSPLSINVSQLSTGLYLVKMLSVNAHTAQRLLISR